MTSSLENIGPVTASGIALFLDFDGTLAAIAERPSDVVVAPGVMASLARLHHMTGGAVAIITGRDIAAIDKFLQPHLFTVSGVHGFQTRIADGAVTELASDTAALQDISRALHELADAQEGLLVEEKPGSVALHYRARPDLAEWCKESVGDAAAPHDGLRILAGKMVIEVKAHRGDKGAAIDELMRSPPFAGRVPVFIGDDVTDEAGFRLVNELGGISIKVGDGPSAARYRLREQNEVPAWLEMLFGQLQAGNAEEGDPS